MIGQSPQAPESAEAARPAKDAASSPPGAPTEAEPAVEIGGRDGPEPTRYGDWEKNGRCIDF
jgi:hypothetical protein